MKDSSLTIPKDFKLKTNNKIDLHLHFAFLKFDLVNLLEVIANNTDSLAKVEVFCEELTFDENKYQLSGHFKGDKAIPDN